MSSSSSPPISSSQVSLTQSHEKFKGLPLESHLGSVLAAWEQLGQQHEDRLHRAFDSMNRSAIPAQQCQGPTRRSSSNQMRSFSPDPHPTLSYVSSQCRSPSAGGITNSRLEPGTPTRHSCSGGPRRAYTPDSRQAVPVPFCSSPGGSMKVAPGQGSMNLAVQGATVQPQMSVPGSLGSMKVAPGQGSLNLAVQGAAVQPQMSAPGSLGLAMGPQRTSIIPQGRQVSGKLPTSPMAPQAQGSAQPMQRTIPQVVLR